MAAPSHANISITIGGKDITISHKNFSNIKLKRRAGDVCNNFTLQILDEDTFEIEAMILAGNNDIFFSYIDGNGNIVKQFRGSIIKLDNTFVDDRVMLTLEGFVGLSAEDKFKVRTINWNVVPKFNWSDIFTDADMYDLSQADYESEDTWQQVKNGISVGFKSLWVGIKQTCASLFSLNPKESFRNSLLNLVLPGGGFLFNSMYKGMESFYEGNPEKVIQNAMDHDYGTENAFKYNQYFGKDDKGYYFISQKEMEKVGDQWTDAINDAKALYNKQNTATKKLIGGVFAPDNMNLDVKKPKKVYAEGEFIIPVRPGKIVECIAQGKEFSYILESDFKKYKGTEFYDGKSHEDDGSVSKDEDGNEIEGEGSSASVLDWLFITLWFRNRGKVESAGWQIGHIDKDTLMIQDNLTQTKKSYIDYLNSTISEKCVKVFNKKMEVDNEKGVCNLVDTKEFLSNYRCYADDDGKINFERFDLRDNATIATKEIYTLYGIDKNSRGYSSSGNNGYMTNFNASLNILTAMITGGTGDASAGDISTMNIITGGTTSVTISKSTNFDEGETYVPDWGVIEFLPNFSTVHPQSDIATVFDKAKNMTYRATCTIEGNHNLSPQDFIEIIIIPKSSGMRHHSSGKYYILSIDETIQDGKRVSTLDMIKNVHDLDSTRPLEKISSEKLSRVIVKENTYYTVFADGHVEYHDAPSSFATPAGGGASGGGGRSW